MTRRDMLIAAGLSAAAQTSRLPPVVAFSKHAAKLNWKELGAWSRSAGFDGVDLTVRKGGHVEPEKAAADLKPALETIGNVRMLTTNLTRPEDVSAADVFRSGIPFIKAGYLRYGPNVEESLAGARRNYTELAKLAQKHGVTLGLHNHSGDYVGSLLWDLRDILSSLDAKAAGYYFDPAHATIEGGLGGWKLNTSMVLPRMKMMAAKDFYWEKRNGKWAMVWAPIGEGMVDWKQYFGMLAKAHWNGPISLHVEYKSPDELEAMARDCARLKEFIAAAWASAPA
jgi:L-ribulose-5-phosphate 3-epimerase